MIMLLFGACFHISKGFCFAMHTSSLTDLFFN